MIVKKFSFTVFFALLIFSANAFGQQQAVEDQTTADENFKVNITDKKITETNYESKVELNLKPEKRSSVSVNIGAAVRAGQITVSMKNVFGDVRFRGSLEKITNQINLLRPAQKQK